MPAAVGSDGESLAPAIFLDPQALPAGWVYVENDQVATVLPGGTVSSFGIIASNPAVSRAQFFIDFSKPVAAAATSDAVATKLLQVRSRKQDLAMRWRAAAYPASTAGGVVRHERSWRAALRAPDPR